jgi:hypothetical protein
MKRTKKAVVNFMKNRMYKAKRRNTHKKGELTAMR